MSALAPDFLDRELPKPGDAPIKLKLAFELYVARHLTKQHYAKSVILRYEYVAKRWNRAFHDLCACDVTPSHCRKMMVHFERGSKEVHGRSDENGKVMPVASATIAVYHKCLTVVMGWLYEYQFIEHDPYFRVTLVKIPKDHRRVVRNRRALVTDQELADVLATEKNEATRDIWQLIDLCGARPSELSGLKMKMVDTSRDIWIYEPTQHKTAWMANDRLIQFGPRCQEILIRHKCKRRHEDGTIFRTDSGKSWTTDRLKLQLRKACKRAGISPYFSMRDIRNRFSNRIDMQYGPEIESVVLGHTQEVAARHYRRKNIAILEAVAAEVS